MPAWVKRNLANGLEFLTGSDSSCLIGCSQCREFLCQPEKQTEDFKTKAKNCDNAIASKWTTATSDLTHNIRDIDSNQLLLLEEEDDQFKEEFNRVINSKDIPDVDDITDQETGVQDLFNMPP